VRALKAELDALLSRHKPAKGTARTDLEVRTRNQLEALGYVD
jgi:hypothetical protein